MLLLVGQHALQVDQQIGDGHELEFGLAQLKIDQYDCQSGQSDQIRQQAGQTEPPQVVGEVQSAERGKPGQHRQPDVLLAHA